MRASSSKLASRCGCSQPTALPTNDDGLGGIESLFFITYQGASSKAMSRSCRIRFLPLTPTTEQSSFALCRQGCRNKEGKGAMALQILTEPYVDLGGADYAHQIISCPPPLDFQTFLWPCI